MTIKQLNYFARFYPTLTVGELGEIVQDLKRRGVQVPSL